MNNLIKKILVEWSYRLDDGMINLHNPKHMIILSEVLKDMKLPTRAILEVMSNLTEKEKVKPLSDKDKQKMRDMGLIWKGKGYGKEGEKGILFKNVDGKLVKTGDGETQKTKPKVNVFTKQKTEPTDTSTKTDTPTETDNTEFEKNIKSKQKNLRKSRLEGEGGLGGPKASYGENQYTTAINEIDIDEFKEKNKDTINKKKKEIENRKKFPTAAEERKAKVLGLDPNSDEFKEYIAMRETYIEQQGNMHENEGIFKKFDKSRSAMDSWNGAAFDGMYTTKKAIKESGMKNANVLQSTPEIDAEVKKDLEKKKDNACKKPESEDCKYYTRELNEWKLFSKFHDTFAIGQDEKGRTMIISVSNKKSDKADDGQANTTTAQRLKLIKEKYGEKIAESVKKALDNGIKKAQSMKSTTIKNTQSVKVDDDFVEMSKLADSNGKLFKEINNQAKKPCKTTGSGKREGLASSNTKFACWLKEQKDKDGNPIDWDKLSDKQKLEITQKYTADKDWREGQKLNEDGLYEPFAKMFIKVGEVGTGGHRESVRIRINARKQAIKQGDEKYGGDLLSKLQKEIEKMLKDNKKKKASDRQKKEDDLVETTYKEHLERGGEKSIYDKQKDGDSESLSQSTNVKKTEQNTIDEVYKDTVKAMDDADEQWAKDNPEEAEKQGIPPKNGPNKQAYIESVLDALHYNDLIDLEDDRDHKFIQQMGIVGAKASDIRNCLAELSGYDIPPGDRKGLKKHLRENCQVNAETGKISVKSDKESGGKELMSDEFRTAGTSDKVDSKHGVDMRECIINKVSEKAKKWKLNYYAPLQHIVS